MAVKAPHGLGLEGYIGKLVTWLFKEGAGVWGKKLMFRRAKEKPMTFLQKKGRMKSVCMCARTHTYEHAYMHQKYLDEGKGGTET